MLCPLGLLRSGSGLLLCPGDLLRSVLPQEARRPAGLVQEVLQPQKQVRFAELLRSVHRSVCDELLCSELLCSRQLRTDLCRSELLCSRLLQLV
ncbi:MAG: hypothetical protein ACK5Q5_11630 [Planctomycetaceae bacterium]